MVKHTKGAGRLARRLGENIAARRRARKWTQEELAERLGVASETISRFERGATLPSLLSLHRLGEVLKAPVAGLLVESSCQATP
jgi:transcriptional regulator with XRE-family HTH domain